MILATYIDGRALAYDEDRYQFFIGGSPVSLSEVRGWDNAGQLQWRSDAQHAWMTALVESDLVAAAQQAAANAPQPAAETVTAQQPTAAPEPVSPLYQGSTSQEAPQGAAAAPQGAPTATQPPAPQGAPVYTTPPTQQQPVYGAQPAPQQPIYGAQPPRKKHTVAIVVSIVVALLVVCIIVAIVMTAKMTGEIVDAAKSYEYSNPVGSTDGISTDGDTVDTSDVGTSGVTASDVKVDLSGYWLTTGADGTTPVIVIETTVTNNSDKDIVYWDAVYDEVEQNGETLSYATMDDSDYDSGSYLATIAKGQTYTVQNAYILKDTKSEVEVYLFDWSSGSDQSLVAMGTVDVTE